MRIRIQFLVPVLCGLLVSVIPCFAANSAKKLSPNYRHWLEQEIPYIISGEERKEFLSLTTDQERDSFIAAFWRVRNPDPSSEANTYKEEHYRRLAYANEHFGTLKYENGWRTAMGRIYIVLGAPKQRAVYHEKANIRPIEIWFYESQTPALPPYFYILFFKHSASEDWSVYSPRIDGPIALVTTGESQNDNRMALRFIRKSVGDEVAKTACTLMPTESVDFDNFSPTMESDIMLETINDLPDNPLTKATREANRMRERVTTSILTGDKGMSISSAVFRDEEGRETLSYLLSSARPDASIVGTHSDGSLYYDQVLRTSVLTSDGKPVYDQEEELTGKLTPAEAEVARTKIFAAEARAPLAPGTYTLVATLTNNISHVAARQQASITVPSTSPQRIGISELIEYGNPAVVPDPANQLPFSASKVRFTPRAAQIVNLRAGEKLPLAFQLWLAPKTGEARVPENVHLRYVFGTVTASAEAPTVENEDIEAANRDKAGNLISGRTVDTSTLLPGTYRLVVTATREGDPRPAYAAITLHVVRAEDFIDRWTAYGSPEPGGVALDNFKRGLSAEAQGSDDAAKKFYSRALTEDSTDARPLDRLAALLEKLRQTDELAELSRQPILTKSAVDPKTLLTIVQALTEAGNSRDVVRMLETQIKLQPPSANLYLALANACETTGDLARARDLRSLAGAVK